MTTKLINLLPKEEKKRDVRSIILNVLMVLVIILFAATLILTFFLFDIDNMLSSRLSEYESVNIKVQDQVNKLKVYDNFKKEVDGKTEVLTDLRKNDLYWSKVLYEIGKVMPEDAFIESFETQGSRLYNYLSDFEKGEAEEGEEVVSFSIYGQAASYVDVLKLSIELKKIENIKVVWIESITRVIIPGTDIEVVSYIIDTYWDLEIFTEDIDKNIDNQDENQLDEDIIEI